MKAPLDTGFIHDLSQLDVLRQKAANGEQSDDALKAAAEQFEALFTQMLFKSMRQANEAFESDLVDNRTSKFYEQMADEQLASALSREGSLGLADLIVQQFKGSMISEPMDVGANSASDRIRLQPTQPSAPLSPEADALKAQTPALGDDVVIPSAHMLAQQNATPAPKADKPFESPDEFVSRLTPYAKKAARMLGTDPALLIAQAALETGWGKKVIANARGSSNNLFNIKADPRWYGGKVATQTLEFYDDIPVQEMASFRAYASYEDSFNDYVSFLNRNPRYATALQQSAQPEQFIRGIHQAGYATDPQYSDKVLSVFNRVKGMMEP
ncbi:flagellar assembly peptidoglycan hydrolase FlgJ [Enterovibrio paralichthyis]|uniref:flagellar assembly peptidoglycan hydrolase FlgJ n=1 Tax=Enterovibrio paralichthyis TaxID=2853805 RepID=UPI001C439464|nr:flagellar assembly peptidoglycan hydrolase FlgJ [Enterovibrio paralichthyis]MBV7298530.1 flagellar assembly peptidoglycan hydrolase FlgJ [Enterovibrio paralichthyis]